MHRAAIADALDELGTLLELQGANPFKVRAYRNGARVLRQFDGDFATLVRDGRLGELKGFGKALAEKVTALINDGRIELLERLRADTPTGMFELLELPGLGPKRLRALHAALGIASVGELEAACRDDRLTELPGFGVRSQAKLLEAIAQHRRHRARTRYHRALAIAEPLLEALRGLPGVARAEPAGSLRRRMETVKDIDLLAAVAPKHRQAVGDWLAHHPDTEAVTAQGPTKVSVALAAGLNCDLRMVALDEWGSALAHFTGSRDHNIALRQRALDRGLRLSEWGLFRDDQRSAGATEAELHAALGLAWIPPELREDRGEITTAAEGGLPRLVEQRDVRGALHNHTDWSDGRGTLHEMAAAAQALGWEWLGIADHSPSVRYANGLSVARLREQMAAIATLNAELDGLVLLAGSEVDILPDGTLDLPDDALAELDYVVVAVHSHFGLSRHEQTARICRAVAHPRADVLAHPTGRLLLARDGYDVDMARVIDACADHGTAIEINANPHRLDLDWRHHRRARERGVRLTISPDAHRPESLAHARFGVGVTRKGGLEADDLLNCLGLTELRAWLTERR